MNRHLYILVMLVTAAASADNAELRGRIVDAGQAPLPNALVRLIPKGERFAVFRSVADRNGGFSLGGIPEGSYSMRIGLLGFKERALPGLELHSGETRNIGAILLDLAGCDAPGVICDSVVVGKPQPVTVISQGYITMNRNWGADLDSGRVFQSDEMNAEEHKRGSDVVLLRDAGSWQVIPVNGAFLAQTDCLSAKFREMPIRLDGMGPGAEVCVQTNRHHHSHVFIVDEIRPETSAVRLWHVTRR